MKWSNVASSDFDGSKSGRAWEHSRSILVATKVSLVVPSSEWRGKLGSGSKIDLSRWNLGSTRTTMWFMIEYCQLTARQWNAIAFVQNWIYRHKVLHINYTIYDLHQVQDVLNP